MTMRECEYKIVTAIRQGRKLTVGNTKYDGKGNVYLHGNLIARGLHTVQPGWGFNFARPEAEFSFAGWKTRTTASRLRALIRGLHLIHPLQELPYIPSSSEKDPKDPSEWWKV